MHYINERRLILNFNKFLRHYASRSCAVHNVRCIYYIGYLPVAVGFDSFHFREVVSAIWTDLGLENAVYELKFLKTAAIRTRSSKVVRTNFDIYF